MRGEVSPMTITYKPVWGRFTIMQGHLLTNPQGYKLKTIKTKTIWPNPFKLMWAHFNKDWRAQVTLKCVFV